MLILAEYLRERLFITLLLVGVPAVFAAAHGQESCHQLVGYTYFVNGSTPPLDFAEKRTDGIYLGQHVPGGQKFQVTGLVIGDNTEDDIVIRTEDGRTLNILCSQFEAAMGPSPVGQQIIESDAPDFQTAMARFKAKRKAAAKAVARRGGVRVGMTERQVLASSWGTPDHRNRTITANGETEQWVYGDGNYLYFEDGILTAIQTE